ncbi:hypothetical protein L1987_61251 [Smallanthus sonchifolius]|uniref:Uncharacterized protein n=1 Tax=Smallanthus sonchifolius TaxID=185202 RepID=A0ACB9DAM4_9ASTR|nr:hypothetical protein L1987_61251 [Smallanthus sonchifolius]
MNPEGAILSHLVYSISVLTILRFHHLLQLSISYTEEQRLKKVEESSHQISTSKFLSLFRNVLLVNSNADHLKSIGFSPFGDLGGRDQREWVGTTWRRRGEHMNCGESGKNLKHMHSKWWLQIIRDSFDLNDLLLFCLTCETDAQSVGVCYGRNGYGLPSERDVVRLYQRNNITRMRIYDPHQPTLEALRGTNIELMIGVPNDRLQSLNDQNAANTWVRDNIQRYPNVRFRYIAVGNNVDPNNGNSRYVPFVLRAMQNVHNAVRAAGLVIDNGRQYFNLFDAMLDAHYAAQARLGGGNVEIVVSESGWPSSGGPVATIGNAGTYYRNLIAHVRGTRGTPLKPGRSIETYLFEMFDENRKPGIEVERHFGIFTPNQQPKYGQLSFN